MPPGKRHEKGRSKKPDDNGQALARPAPKGAPTAPYMRQAKLNTSSGAKFNLTASGLHTAHASDFKHANIFNDKEYGYGNPALLQAIAAHSGVGVDRVFTITGGTSMANNRVFDALLRQGDHIVVEQPVYPLLKNLGEKMKLKIATVRRPASLHFGIDLDHLESVVTHRTKIVVLTNLHNPSGFLATPAMLRAAGDIARRHGAKVLVDEVYLDAAQSAKPKTAALLGDDFIVTSSLTKVYGLGFLRAGWVLGSREFIARLWDLNDVFDVVPPTINERAQVHAWKRLHTFAKRSFELLDANHAEWDRFVEARPSIISPPNKFGTTAFPTLVGATGATINRLERYLLREHQTGIVPGHWFGAPEHFRVSLCCNTNMLEKGLSRLDIALRRRAEWDRCAGLTS